METLDKLISLQTLIKREIALKGYFKQSQKDLEKEMDDLCIKLYRSKLNIMEIYSNEELAAASSNLKKPPKPFKFKLYTDENSKTLEKTMIESILYYIRFKQNIVYKICLRAQKKTFPELASFLTNSFYENILSSSFIEDEFLLLVYRLLKHEVSKLTITNSTEGFLNESNITVFILRCLAKKDDIKAYFWRIINDIIVDMESRENQCVINFDFDSISKEISKEKEGKKKKSKKSSSKEQEQSQKDNDSSFECETSQTSFVDEDSFTKKYIPDLTKKELYKLVDDEKELGMKDYLIKQITELKNFDMMFANKEYTKKLYESEVPTKVFEVFREYFFIVRKVILQLIDNLCKNINIIPYSIKCVCKMISLLIKRKFRNIISVEENSFIAEFFFKCLLEPIFLVPDFNCLLTSVLVSKVTTENISLISSILNQLMSGNFYKAKETPSLTVFNRLFIEVMNKVNHFMKALTDVKLPNIIEKILLNDQDPNSPEYINLDTFVYDYFKENPKEKMNHISICYTTFDFLRIFNILRANEKEILPGLEDFKTMEKGRRNIEEDARLFYGAYSKLVSYDKYLTEIESQKIEPKIKLEEKEEKDEDRRIIRHFLLRKNHIEGGFKQLIDVMPGKAKKQKELSMLSEEDKKKLNLGKIKGYLSKILQNFQSISKEDFPVSSFEELLTKIQEYSKVDYFLLDNSIPLEWYIISITKIIDQIPREYKEDDYSLIYKELAQETEENMKKRDIQPFLEMKDKLRYTEREIKNIDIYLKKLKQVKTNKSVKRFIEETKIEVYMKVPVIDGKKRFVILSKEEEKKEKYKNLDNFLFEKKKVEISSKDINSFIRKFPNFVNQTTLDAEVFEFQKNLCVPEAIKHYMDFVKEEIVKSKLFVIKKEDRKDMEDITENKDDNKKTKEKQKFAKDPFQEKKYEEIFSQIYSYIFSRIHDKLFPTDSDGEDIKIYHNCSRHSWLEPEHIIHKKGLNLINFLPESQGFLMQFENEKSPCEKMTNILKISKIICQLLNFSVDGENQAGVDDTQDFYVFALIKAQPKRLNSNLTYIEMYLDKDLKSGNEDLLLTQLTLSVDFIKTLHYDERIISGISEDKYNENCMNASSEKKEQKSINSLSTALE